jgi:hypothetical protein
MANLVTWLWPSAGQSATTVKRLGYVAQWTCSAAGVGVIALAAFVTVSNANAHFSSMDEIKSWDADHPASTPTDKDGIVQYTFEAKDGHVYKIEGPPYATRADVQSVIDDQKRGGEWSKVGTLFPVVRSDDRPYPVEFNYLGAFVAMLGAAVILAGKGIRYILSGD